MTNTVNRMKLALVLALVAGLLAATIGLFGSGWPPSVSAQTDTTAPTVSSVAITSDAGNGVYGIGDDIEATVTFSEDVTVTDTPRLGLDIGGTSKTASYESTSGSTVVFSYTVAEGDSDHDGIAIRANRLILSGGTIRDAADNDADLSHDALSAQEDHEVDGIRPSVSRIYIPASTHTTDRAFTIGDPIWIYTDWSERLYVTGNPQLTLDFDGTSKTSTYTDGWLGHFSEYTVVEGDSAPDGVAIPANAISLNGGSIRDRAGNDAVLTHSAVSADSLSWTFIPVDGIRPTITSIEIISDPGDDDTYTAGDEIRILVTFSENIQPVDRSGEGRIFQTTIELNIGGKARTAEHFGHLDAVIALTYTVQAGDTDANGISIDANKMWNGPVLHPDGYTLLDRPSASNWAAGNPADVSHDAVADDSGHKVAAAPQPNNPATGAPTISGTVQVGETLWTNTAGIADNDGLDNADFAYQWITNDGTIDTGIAGATGATYTLVSEDAGKTIRVQVSFTDDTGNKERLTSTPTAAVSAAPPPPPDNVRAVTQKSGAVELTWEAPDGATVAGYRIERRRADEDRRGNHTLVEDTGSSETGYTDESAEKGVEYEYRVSARNEDGAGEASGWVSAATVPTISSVAITSDPDDDDLSEYYDDSVYAIGDSIKVTATFSENVTVTGAPKLEVNIGGKAKTATYDSSKDNEVVFSYTVAEGDSDTDGIAVGANKLSLNAGTIKDGADNSAVLTHSALSVQSGHKVDGIRPTVTSVYFVPTSFGNDGIHTIGERLWVQVVLSEDFRVYIGPRIILNLEGTSTSVGFSPLSRGSNLVFFYIVKKGDLDLDGVSVSANSLTARGLTDAAGNDAVLTHTGVSEDPDYIVDGVPPTVSSIAITSDPGDDDTYSIGNKIEITVTLSEDVGVFFGPWGGPWDGPQVALNIGGIPKSASFVSENAGVMLFSYTVKYGDNDADGVSIDANSLSGGIVRDTNGDSFSSGNDADLRHTSVDDDADHKVTTTTPAKSADATLSGLTLTDVNFGTFASGTTSYSADVANSVTQTTVTPTVNHSDASYIIKLGGVTDADETVALAVGSNVITVEVTAEDGNTTRTYTVTVTRAATSISAPDLTVPSVITSSSPFGYNPSFNLGVNVTNRGSGSSGLTTLHYYRSTDSTITSGDAEVGTDSVDALAASGISNEDIDLTAPDTPGTYYYGACVDAVADESDTTNNCSPGIAWVVPAAPSSTDATGAPAISGTVQVGETLTADTSGIADDDGLENVSFSYQWLTDDTAIQGATNSTYTLIEADEGKTVKVRVSFTDDAGNDETLTSAATDAVAATPNSPATGAPTIGGTIQVGETLTADTSGIADADGLENVTHSYQWLAGDSDISGATGSAYTLADADEGKAIKVKVSFTDDGGNDETLTSAATEAVAGNKEPVAREDVVAWSAIMTVEWVYQGYGYYSTHAKKAGSLSPASFEVDGTTYTVKMVETQGWWMYIGVDRELPFDFVLELNGTRFASNDASFNSYNYGNIYRWEGTGLSLRDGDAVEVRLLRAIEDETAVNSAATGAPTISGTAQVGETLTADTSGVEDADGLDNAVFGYQWLAGDTDISGATGSTYTLPDADEGKAITVQVSFTDDAGNDETLTSAATDAVTAAPTSNNPSTGAPTISGTVQVGETLTVDTSGISDADGLTNATLSYQWLADDADISGATGSTYTLTDSDEGKAIKVQVSFTDDAGNDETLTSAATDPVDAALAANSPATGAPTISGTAQVGETLTVDTSDIADMDGLTNADFSYQWQADDTAIQGAMGSSYTLADTDEGKAIKVQVSFTDDGGSDETLTSAATDAVAALEPPARPTGLTAEVSHDSVTLTWDGPNDDSITGYVILRRDEDIHEEGTFETVESDTGSAGTTYTDDTVEPEKQYVYRIKAINADGLSEISSWVRADTPAAPTPEPPAAPSGLTAEVSNNTVTLIWDDPNDDTITGYVILRRNRDTDAEGQFTELVADTGSAATGYTDDTVAAETPYTYRIKAINEHGTSERSRWVHVETTAAPTPEGTPEQSVSEGDTDLPNDNSTPGRVAVGGSATGTIGTAGEQDRFAVELVAGRTYQFDLTGSPGGGGTLPDTFFRAIYNSEGQYQADSYNDDFDGGRDSRVTFTPTESGTYYARVSGDRDETGSYTLSVTDVTPQ